MSYCITLNNGVFMPVVGLGTWGLSGSLIPTACTAAVSSGYRHFDSASCYGNEKEIGSVLPKCVELINSGNAVVSPPGKCDVPDAKWRTDEELRKNKQQIPTPLSSRESLDPLFITTKVWVSDFGVEQTKKSVDRSLKAFGLDRLDLVLLHWPTNFFSSAPSSDQLKFNQAPIRKESWRALEDAYAQKKVRAIGVSNYTARHLRELCQDIDRRKSEGDKNAMYPLVNQLECNPCCQLPEELINLCAEWKIRLVSYSTMGGDGGVHKILGHPVINELAKKYGKSPAQICLRWCLQKNISIIPRSKNPQRIAENMQVFDFEISDEDMKKLKNEDNQKLRFCPDPNILP